MNNRRLREGLLWREATPPKRSIWSVARDAIWIALVLLAALGLYSWTQNRDMEDRLAEQKRTTQKYSGMVAAVMNGGALIDHNTGAAYFFSKPTEIQLGSK